MKKLTKINGIVYRTYDSGAYDKVVCIVSDTGSKVALLAKGIKKPNSRKAHSIDLGNFVTFKIVEGYKIPIVSETLLINEHLGWKTNYENLVFLQLMCEVIGNFVAEDNDEPSLFKVFRAILELLNYDKKYLVAIFLFQVLLYTGNLPKLNECILSGAEVDSTKCFSDSQNVGYNTQGIGNKVSARIFKTQRFIEKTGLYSGLRVSLAPEEIGKMFRIHLNWLEIVIGKELKSKKFVE